MIGLSATTFDLDGALLLKGANLSSDADSGERRVAKYKTIDGGVSIFDNGFVAADSKYQIRVRQSDKSTAETVRHLISSYAVVIVTSIIGAFRGVISSYRYASGDLIIVIDLIESA